MGLFSGIASAVKGAVAGFNPVGMLASAAVNALVGKYQTRQQNKAIDAANATALQRESTQFERLRDSAVRAGFNPLTALRSGMFQQANLFAREADTFRGDLFGGLAKAVLAMPQARLDAEMRDLERRERETNILYTGVLAREALGRLGQMGRSGGINEIDVTDYVGNRVTDTSVRGNDHWFNSPFYVDIGEWEERYGDIEILSAAGAGLQTIRDAAYSAGLNRISIHTGQSKEQVHQIIANSPNPRATFDAMMEASRSMSFGDFWRGMWSTDEGPLAGQSGPIQ